MSCCAVGCQNRKSVNSGLKFYRIPSTRTPFNANRRRLWLQAIRRADWNEDQIKNARLCGSHFISGEVSMEFNSPDFVPSLFSFSTQCEIYKGDAKLERFKRKRKRDEPTHRRPDDVQQSKEVTDKIASASAGACLSSDDCRMEPVAGPCTDNEVDDVEGGFQEIQSVKIENDPLILTQQSNESSTSTESSTTTKLSISKENSTCTQPSTSRQPPVQGMLKSRRPCCTALHLQYQDFLERIQHSQNMWLERQLEQSHVQEERLISRVLAEHTHSMEALVNQLFAGLRSLLPQPPPNIQSNPQSMHTPPEIPNTYPHMNPDEHLPPANNPKSRSFK